MHLDATHTEVNARLSTCYRLYDEYRWLLDSYIVDFFVDNYWEMLLPSWKEFFDNNKPEIVVEILSCNQRSPKVIYPLSMLAVRKLIQNNMLPRKQIGEETPAGSSCTNVFLHSAVDKLFWKHVKQKKIHEISSLGRKCAEVARKLQVDLIVDCGSGLGHLARFLAYKFKLSVICLEAQENLTKRATELDQEFERKVVKYDQTLLRGCHRPTHLNHKLQNNMSHVDLLTLIDDGNESASRRIGLIGLHPCGDLASALLRLFKTCHQITFVCVVGCCYMKLTEIGHPLSQRLSCNCLSYPARELACHAIEKLACQIREEGAAHLRTHAWRAALEEILVSRWPNMRHAALRSVKYSQDISFRDYCFKALESSGLRLSDEDLRSERVCRMLQQADRVVTFNCLRALFAPLLETMILLDRWLYTCETEGVTATLEPVFDPHISARNHLLTAYK